MKSHYSGVIQKIENCIMHDKNIGLATIQSVEETGLGEGFFNAQVTLRVFINKDQPTETPDSPVV